MGGLEERAMLVNVTVRTWTGIVTDLEASKEVAWSKNADASYVRLKKRLLGEYLKEVQAAARTVREYVRKNTLPWYDDNWRILPSEHFFEFTQELRKRIDAFNDAVKRFLDQYPGLLQRAKTYLGDLYKDRDFPSPEGLKMAFRCDVDFMPIPRGRDFRLQMVEEALEEVRAQVEERYRESFTRIKEDLMQRIRELALRIENCLGGEKKVVTKALVRDVQKAPELLRRLNVLQDPEVEAAIGELEKLAAYDVEFVRKSSMVQGLFLAVARRLKAASESTAPLPNRAQSSTPACAGGIF